MAKASDVMVGIPMRFIFRPLTINTNRIVDFLDVIVLPKTVLSRRCDGQYRVMLGVEVCGEYIDMYCCNLCSCVPNIMSIQGVCDIPRCH